MQEIRIGLDIDGVCAGFQEYFSEYFNLEGGPPTDWDDPRYRENYPKIEYDENFWVKLPKLFDPNELIFTPCVYITARSIDSSITQRWLDENGFPKAPLVTVGFNGSKIESCKEHMVDIFLDDSYRNFTDLINSQINCCLITRSHNTKYNVDPEMRYENVMDFQERFFKTKVNPELTV